MNIYRLFAKIWKQLYWYFPAEGRKIFLTFDDGPGEGVTEEILRILNEYNAKATFFCLGEKVERNPFLYKKILESGHLTGNHTYGHLNGWKTGTEKYLADTYKAAKYIHSSLMRPPYGKISPLQAKLLSKHFKLVMWDVISYDYKQNYTPERIFKRVIRHTRSGSIVVFHDTPQAAPRVIEVLPKVITYFQKRGYEFSSLPVDSS
ncbi:MAG: polysaccharide deacetylase family protein [Bacteroidales bacterium]